ncbi:hypothetical protein JCGZ_10011 [Jatropha curcas]|uniref:Uncharacterized protein n=1 Tax=Jatropha curcas TaxID=180498 RepID=A0A067KUT6_JATCU|nr:hypothetical protein JCGZ_10011 [Jatropha curcas]
MWRKHPRGAHENGGNWLAILTQISSWSLARACWEARSGRAELGFVEGSARVTDRAQKHAWIRTCGTGVLGSMA